LGLVQIVIGLFGVSEILITLERGVRRTIFETEIKGLLPTLKDWKESIFPIARGSMLGFFLGIIPGMSVVIPTFVTYALEKKISKHPEKFGTGVIEGVAAPEAANNAASSGTMIPLLSLGIPCGAASALVLGAMMIYGVVPGPMLISQSPHIFWGVIGSMYVGNVMLLLLNLPMISLWVKTLKTPYPILFTLILLFCLIGSYTVANSTADMVIMIVFGFVGYLMKKFDYEMAPMVMGLVLGPLMEKTFRTSMLMSHGSPGIFFRRPISMVLLVLALLVLISPLITKKRLGEDIVQDDEELR
jgi:putative tricarboxylic transport membrane protein